MEHDEPAGLLQAWAHGGKDDLDRVVPALYAELRSLARHRLRRAPAITSSPSRRAAAAGALRAGALQPDQPRRRRHRARAAAADDRAHGDVHGAPAGPHPSQQRSGPTAQLDQTNPDADQVVRARWITDVRDSWQLRARLEVAASVASLFDVYPNEWWDFKDGLDARGTSMQGIFRHPGALSPFGMNGRAPYLQATWR